MYATKVKRETPYGSIIFELPEDLEELAERELGSQGFGGMLRVAEFRELHVLAPTQTYDGKNWMATRRRIDQLDNVTFTVKRQGK